MVVFRSVAPALVVFNPHIKDKWQSLLFTAPLQYFPNSSLLYLMGRRFQSYLGSVSNAFHVYLVFNYTYIYILGDGEEFSFVSLRTARRRWKIFTYRNVCTFQSRRECAESFLVIRNLFLPFSSSVSFCQIVVQRPSIHLLSHSLNHKKLK